MPVWTWSSQRLLETPVTRQVAVVERHRVAGESWSRPRPHPARDGRRTRRLASVLLWGQDVLSPPARTICGLATSAPVRSAIVSGLEASLLVHLIRPLLLQESPEPLHCVGPFVLDLCPERL